MSPDNPQQPEESALNSWPLEHQQIAKKYASAVKDLPGVVKVIGAYAAKRNMIFLGIFYDLESPVEVSDIISDEERKLKEDHKDIEMLFMPYDRRDSESSNLMEILRGEPDYIAPTVLFEQQKETSNP